MKRSSLIYLTFLAVVATLVATCPGELRPFFGFVFASLLLPLATGFALPMAARRWRQFAASGQPVEEVRALSLRSRGHPLAGCFVAIEPDTGTIMSVPLRRGESPPGFSAACRVLVSSSRFGKRWVVHGLAPPG